MCNGEGQMKKRISGIGGVLAFLKNGKSDHEILEKADHEILEGKKAENTPAFSSDKKVDILMRHALPCFERMQKEDQEKFVNSLQVLEKVKRLSVGKEQFLYPELNLEFLEKEYAANKIDISDFSERIVYRGNSSSELQKIIDENSDVIIEIQSKFIEVTESIQLKSNIYLIGNGVEWIGRGVRFLFLVSSVKNVCMDSLYLNGGAEYGIYIVDSERIAVRSSLIQGFTQKPICIVGRNYLIEVYRNVLRENGAGGIWVSGDAASCVIEKNRVCENYGTSNWMAGIVLTNVESQDALNIWETFGDAHHFPYKENLYVQLKSPHKIIVRGNEVWGNQASGIYSDGAYLCYIMENNVKGNDKEGICLDYGTIGFYVKKNIFESNGERARQTDEDLRFDFVLGLGRMENGSAKSKLPGISLDNTAYNIVENNVVINNFGGGIKMVRTTVRSLIIENIVKDNNQGQNDVFHFFGIEVGAAIADMETPDLDFTPDYENIICRNIISGEHYSGVFIGEGCYVNDVFDNVIMEPQMFAVEAISIQFNSILNNISNVGIRNEYR